MVKKFLLICLALLLSMHSAAFAKKNSGLPENERIKVAVEITDSTRHKKLATAQNFELFIGDKLAEKNLLSVVDTKILGEDSDEDFTADEKPSAEDIGELLVFEAVELPTATNAPENFNTDDYKSQGADYVIRCEILALGITYVEDTTFSTITAVAGGGLSFFSASSSHRDRNLRRVGTCIGLLGFIPMKRTALNTVVNMQFISVETGQVLWQGNFTGQAIKHHKPSKNFDNEWTQAYVESIADSAKLIAKRVNKYVDKVIIKGKDDKDFTSRKKSIGGGFTTGIIRGI